MIGCCFCDEYSDTYKSAFYSLLGRKVGCCSMVLSETENWYDIPTLGCLTTGYVLLVCKHHYMSLASMNHNLIFEMLKLKEDIENIIYSKLHLRCVVFEHGSSTGGEGANSVEHVHIHIVPLQEKIWNDISKRNSITHFCKMDNYFEFSIILYIILALVSIFFCSMELYGSIMVMTLMSVSVMILVGIFMQRRNHHEV